MQKERKTKLALAVRAKRHRLLANWLSAAFVFAGPSSVALPVVSSFEVPPTVPEGAPLTISIGKQKSTQSHGDQSQALKRVGIRFVDSASANTARSTQPDTQMLSNNKLNSESFQKPFKLIQMPIATTPSSSAANASAVQGATNEGVRIRISADQKSQSNLDSTVSKTASAVASTASTAAASDGLIQKAKKNAETLKLTVGPLPEQTWATISPPAIPTHAELLKSEPNIVSSAEPKKLDARQTGSVVGTGLAALPSIEPSAMPTNTAASIPPLAMPATIAKVPQQIASPQTIPVNEEIVAGNSGNMVASNKVKARAVSNPELTSRSPVIVKIPSMIVSGHRDESQPQAKAPEASIVAMEVATSASTVNRPMTIDLHSEPTVATSIPVATQDLPKVNQLTAQVTTPIATPMFAPSVPPMAMASVAHTPSLESKPVDRTSPNLIPNPSALVVSMGVQELPNSTPSHAILQRPETRSNRELTIDSMTIAEQSPPLPKFTDPVPRPTRYEPSIVPVALASTKRNAIDSDDAGKSLRTEDAYIQSMSDQQLTRAAVNAGSIDVALKNVQVIKLQGSIVNLKIEDHRVCKVIATEPNCVTVIGASIGDSKLAIWTNNTESSRGGPQIFKVSVREAWGDSAKNMVSIEDANQSIAALFPDASIVIKSNADGSVTVHGKTTTNDSAKQIIMLVRKMFLVPVQDRIAVAPL